MESQAGKEAFQSLRIAVVLDGLTPPAWVASIIRDVPLEAVVLLDTSDERAEYSYLFRRYLQWDSQRIHPVPDPLTPTDVSDVLGGVPRATLNALEPGLDVLLWLSEASPEMPSSPARYGTWFLSDGRSSRSGQLEAYFSELSEHEAVSSSYLLAMQVPGGALTKLGEAHSASELGWSLKRQRSAPFWKAAMLPRAALLNITNVSAMDADIRSRHPLAGSLQTSPPQSSSAQGPSNASVLNFAARNTFRTINRRLRYSDKESHWFVSYRTNSEDFVAHKGFFTPSGLRILPTPSGHFYADPFVLTWKSRTFLYVEDYLYAEARGVLGVLELGSDGQFGSAHQILNRPYHLSYPFVFEHEGEVFMIPETMAAHRIELYRAVEMPSRWELVKILQDDVEAVDTTLWIENGVFYFFTNLVGRGLTPNDLLFLFTADSLTGEWHAHPGNPIGYDVRTARGAGKLFRMGDKLVRPAQDCSVRYGYATQLNEVEVLTRDQFREKPLFRIEPDWTPHLIGTHTLNSNDQVEVIDGQVYRAKHRKQTKES